MKKMKKNKKKPLFSKNRFSKKPDKIFSKKKKTHSLRLISVFYRKWVYESG